MSLDENTPQDDADSRPPKRDKHLNLWLSGTLYRNALQKAGGLRNLRAVMRAFLEVWAAGEYPSPPSELVKKHRQRAQGGGRKKVNPPPDTPPDTPAN